MEAKKVLKITFMEPEKDSCPDMGTICSYSDNSIDSMSKKNLEEHLLSCSGCFSLYVDLYRDTKNDNFIPAPELTVRKVNKQVETSIITSFITNIYKQWSWLSWSSGFAFGALAILMFIFLPSLFNTGKTFAVPGATEISPVPTINYVATGYSDNYIASFHYDKGESLLSSSKKEAKEEFLQTIKYNSDFAEAHWQLAILYEEEGNYEEAMKHWKRYTGLVPKTGSYKEAEEHMKSINKNFKDR